MCKTAYNRSRLNLCRCRTVLRLFDEGGEILCLPIGTAYMLATRETCGTGGPEAIFITFCRRNNAVGRHQNRPVKFLEFLFLLPPGVSIVACKILILLKGRIVMRRQHLGMGVHIHTASLCLL